MDNFSVMMPGKVFFGNGELSRLSEIVKDFSSNCLLITGGDSLKKSGNLAKITSSLEKEKITYFVESIPGEPIAENVDKIVEKYKELSVGVIVSVGGGAVIDYGKAISAMFKNKGSVTSYMEVIGDKKLNGKKVPFIAVPTTAGTGSEATKNAVLKHKDQKRSIRHDNLIPNIALIDPTLTMDAPETVTLYSGMDCFCQLMESFVSTKNNELVEVMILDALKKLFVSFEPLLKGQNELIFREYMSYAAFVSGVGLANCALTSIHGLAGTICGLYDIPHGAACASLARSATLMNIQKILDFDVSNPAADKYGMIGAAIIGADYTQDKNEVYFRAISDMLGRWKEDYNIPTLSELGVKEDDFWKIIDSTNLKANPVVLGETEIEDILRDSYK